METEERGTPESNGREEFDPDNRVDHTGTCKEETGKKVSKMVKWTYVHGARKPSKKRKHINDPDEAVQAAAHSACPHVATSDRPVKLSLHCTQDCTLTKISVPRYYKSARVENAPTPTTDGDWINYPFSLEMKSKENYTLDFTIEAATTGREVWPNFHITGESCLLPVHVTTLNQQKNPYQQRSLEHQLSIYVRNHPKIEKIDGEYVTSRPPSSAPSEKRDTGLLHKKNWLKTSVLSREEKRA